MISEVQQAEKRGAALPDVSDAQGWGTRVFLQMVECMCVYGSWWVGLMEKMKTIMGRTLT